MNIVEFMDPPHVLQRLGQKLLQTGKSVKPLAQLEKHCLGLLSVQSAQFAGQRLIQPELVPVYPTLQVLQWADPDLQ